MWKFAKPEFKKEEFACSCCGRAEMDGRFIHMLATARRKAGIPFIINSGYRCPAHNAAVGSTSMNHVSGKAADIACVGSPERWTMIDALIQAGFRRIGIAPLFIHVDSMNALDAIWLYKT